MQWHQLDHMQEMTSLKTDNHTNTPSLHFSDRMLFLTLNHQSMNGQKNQK